MCCILSEIKFMLPLENPGTEASVAHPLEGGRGRTARTGSIGSATARANTLDQLQTQFAEIAGRFQALVASAGPELCSRPPAPGSWSAVECLQHLSRSADAYFPVWQQVIACAGPRKAEMNAPYQIDFWGRILCWILEPPARIRSNTPVPFQPIACGTVDDVLNGFLQRQERIVAALRRCRGRAIDQVKIASPVDSRIRYSIWSSFVVNAAHQRRHLWQAEQAVARAQTAN
jgi:hypothetical protein